MSAPDVNIEKQKKRHSPALIGMAVLGVLILGFVLFTAAVPVEDDAAMEMGPAPVATD